MKGSKRVRDYYVSFYGPTRENSVLFSKTSSEIARFVLDLVSPNREGEVIIRVLNKRSGDWNFYCAVVPGHYQPLDLCEYLDYKGVTSYAGL